MTTATKRSIISNLKALSKQPKAPRADVTQQKIGKMTVGTIDRLQRSLTTNQQLVTNTK